MLVSYKWLQDFLDLSKTTAIELADKMSRTGIEVEEVNTLQEGLKKIVVGYVKECKKHENSDHLSVCQVDVGEAEDYQIVCGAPNVAAGQKVVVALPGARIVDNIKIKKSKMRGEVSMGMICSLEELGFPESVIPKAYADGIYVLPADAKVGEEVYSYLGMDDPIIELSVTPNRADALSMMGVAHEVGAIYRQKPVFEKKILKETSSVSIEELLTVTVADEKDAPNYRMRVVENLTIKESPLWLQTRLMNAGIRPHNNVVDVTNYVLLLFGQPLHAFDYNKIGSKEILVRRGLPNETLVTLDGVERKVGPENIMITNGQAPVALAGVMGGLDSEVTEETTSVAIEAASFDPALTRKTSAKFNLRSESSARFEKGINLATVQDALDYAAMLMAELGDGDVVAGEIVASETLPEEIIVNTSLEKINQLLGTELTTSDVNEIFEALDFTYSENSGEYGVNIPPRRWDIKIPEDIMEEVARIYGYDNLPSTLPRGESLPGGLTVNQQLIREIRNVLEGSGLSEAISYALTTEEKAGQFVIQSGENVKLASPMSEDHSVMRQSLISGLLTDLSYNVARKNLNVALYEIGNIFIQKEKKEIPEQRKHLALAVTGLWREKAWSETNQSVDFYLIKGIVENLMAMLGADNVRYEATDEYSEMHPGRTAKMILNEEVIGFLGQLHPNIAKAYDLHDTFVCEIDLDVLFALELKNFDFKEVSKYPAVSRDIALLVDKTITNQQLIDVIRTKGGPYLKDVHLFDVFEGEKLGKSKKSLAYSLTFQNPASTLVDEEVTQAMEKIALALENNYSAEIR